MWLCVRLVKCQFVLGDCINIWYVFFNGCDEIGEIGIDVVVIVDEGDLVVGCCCYGVFLVVDYGEWFFG